MKVISFDVDGTLIDLGFVNTFWDVEVPRLYAKKYGLKFDEAFKIVRSAYDELGDEDLRWYKPEYWFKRFSLDESPEEVIERIKHKVKVFPDALETIEYLHKDNELIVVSNAPRKFLDLGIKDIRHYFSRIYSCTSDFGTVRKKPEVYIRICEELKVNPKNVVHVGDHYKFDYEVPRSIGIKAFFIDRINGRDGALRSLTELIEKLKS
ncbi:MAG TPA: HAD family hydrolase [Archaeoglobaceae archaeon]|nr:HAD family hydrolase [Archaeoglobaceae archaeon]